jgi:hypothetical protein
MIRVFAFRLAAAVLVGGLLSGFPEFALAQDTGPGALDENCARTCAVKGYDAAFCSDVCWVPDLKHAAEASNLDWKCMTECNKRGEFTRPCMASCRRH